MVLETLIDPFKIEKKPEKLIIYGYVYSIISIGLSLIIFPSLSTIISVFLIVLCFVPLFHTTFKIEENRDLILQNERNILKEHSRAIEFFSYLFLGIVLAYLTYYLILPSNIVEELFKSQIDTINQINNKNIFEGYFINPNSSFLRIFLNNFKVLFFCVVFSIFYGAGTLFIITWNASVIATAIGSLIKNSIALLTNTNIIVYINVFSKSFLRYFFHGIIEMLAYFLGALAGGIISIAIIRKDYKNKNFEKILVDVVNLIILALILLIVGAFLEIYVSPVLFG